MKQLHSEYIGIRLRTYIAPAAPPILAFVGGIILLLIAVLWWRDTEHLRETVLLSVTTSVAMFGLAWLIRFTARRGMSETTGLLGVIAVAILSTHITAYIDLIDLPIIYAVPYALLIGAGSVAFWPRHWHMVLGSIAVILPLLVVGIRNGVDGEGFFLSQLAVVSLVTVTLLYHMIWKANLRMFRLAQEIEYRAYHDALTGLNNRSRWYELAHFSHQLMSRSVRPCSLLYLDIDRFKTINDRYGHDVGDQILQEVTRVLVRDTRETDVLARFGGEEFVVLLPDIDLPGAIACAQRLHQSVRSIDLLPDGVTVSIGVAESLPIESLEQLINRADKALLQAKETGRNRTVIATGDTFSTLSAQTSPMAARPAQPASGPFAGTFSRDPV